PGVRGDCVESRDEVVLRQTGKVMRRGAGEQGGALIDLIKRVWAHNQAAALTVENRLHERKQRLAGAADREHVSSRSKPAGRHPEATCAPSANGLAQRGNAECRRVARQVRTVG